MEEQAMSDRLGCKNRYYINTATYADPTWTELAQAGDANYNPNVADLDVTKRKHAANGNVAHLAGVRDHTLGVTCFVPAAADTSYDAVADANKNGTTVEIARVENGPITTDSLDAMKMVAHVFGGEEGEPVAGVMTRQFEFKFAENTDTDGPEFGTTLSGDIVVSS
jgi:hypothetical protein